MNEAHVIAALKTALQKSHRFLRKNGFDMTEIDQALALADQVDAQKPRVLVVVSGGIADPIYDDGVDVEVFDWDNFKEDPEGTGGVPHHFADLAEPCDIPVEEA